MAILRVAGKNISYMFYCVGERTTKASKERLTEDIPALEVLYRPQHTASQQHPLSQAVQQEHAN